MNTIQKLPLWKSIMLFGIPSLYFFLLTQYLTPYLTNTLHMHAALSWFITGYLVFVPLFIAALLLVKRESGTVAIKTLLKRLRFKKLSKKDVLWTLGAIGLTFASIGMIMLVSKGLSHELQTTPSFMEFKALQGPEKFYLLLWFPMFFFNIAGEQMLWQGYILPRQELAHGNKAWLVNGLLWTLFHLCFGPDLLIMLLPSLFIIAFTIQKTQNTLTGMIVHAVLNGPMFVLVALDILH